MCEPGSNCVYQNGMFDILSLWVEWIADLTCADFYYQCVEDV